jgi:hypothetical protein
MHTNVRSASNHSKFIVGEGNCRTEPSPYLQVSCKRHSGSLYIYSYSDASFSNSVFHFFYTVGMCILVMKDTIQICGYNIHIFF